MTDGDVFSALKTLLMQSYKNLKMRVGTKCSGHLLWAFFFLWKNLSFLWILAFPPPLYSWFFPTVP